MITRFLGLPVVIYQDTPRVLPDEAAPGVPWPPGFKEEYDEWLRSFFRPRNLVPDGSYLHDKVNRRIYMNPRTAEDMESFNRHSWL